eukprot:1993483-Alexandrium_andersonii.AAC.1
MSSVLSSGSSGSPMSDIMSLVPTERLTSPAGPPPADAGSGRHPAPPWVGPAGRGVLDAAGAPPSPDRGGGHLHVRPRAVQGAR